MRLPFTFGIPLIARASAPNWALVEALLELTLQSIGAQGDHDVQVVIAGHDRPDTSMAHTFLQADWPAAAVRADNLDSGRKKHAISRHVLDGGGGLLMFVDADDWVGRGLVAEARAAIAPDQVGGLVQSGVAIDFRALRACPVPHPAVFAGGFHEVCGSCAVALLRPSHPDPLRRDPTAILHEHYRWIEVAREHGVRWAPLAAAGAYLVNTSANHSEVHGPFAVWRRHFSEMVATHGTALDEAALERFGLGLAAVQAVRNRFVPELEATEPSGGAL